MFMPRLLANKHSSDWLIFIQLHITSCLHLVNISSESNRSSTKSFSVQHVIFIIKLSFQPEPLTHF